MIGSLVIHTLAAYSSSQAIGTRPVCIAAFLRRLARLASPRCPQPIRRIHFPPAHCRGLISRRVVRKPNMECRDAVEGRQRARILADMVGYLRPI